MNKLLQNKFLLLIISITLVVIWLLGITSPLFLSNSNNDFYFILKMFYLPVCHQDSSKSFIYNNLQFLVCSRCLGIYLGIFVGITVLISQSLLNKGNILKVKKYDLRVILFGIFLMLIDIALYNLKIYSYNKIIALITGMIFGTTIIFFIFESIFKSFKKEHNE